MTKSKLHLFMMFWLRISCLRMSFEQIYPHYISSNPSSIPQPFFPLTSCAVFNPLSPCCSACMYIGVGPSTEEWAASLTPHTWRKLTLPPPAATHYYWLFSCGWDFMNPSPIYARNLGWLDLVQILCLAVTAAVCSYVLQPCCVGKYCFSTHVYQPWILRSFCPVFRDYSWTLGRRVYACYI